MARSRWVDLKLLESANPAIIRREVGDGNMGGVYQRGDDDMLAIWQAAIDETVALLREGWA